MLLSINLLLILVSNTFAQHLNYEEQNNWKQEFRSCSGDRQSPININQDDVILNSTLKLNLVNYDKSLKNTIANNNGHTVRITLNPESIKPEITGTAVNGRYIFEELHFHWSHDNYEGTEHSINNEKRSAELHLVHYNQKYGSLIQARDQTDGIVVLSVFFEVSNNGNIALQPIINVLPKIINYNTTALISERLSLSELLQFGEIWREFFYIYKGSLTTPPCSESVTFILLSAPIKIGYLQLNQFRQLFEQPINGRTSRIISNIRETQPRNDRRVDLVLTQIDFS